MKKKIVYGVLLTIWLLILCITVDRFCFPHQQVHRLNYSLIYKGMPKKHVNWLLGDTGLTYALIPEIRDKNSPTGFRPIVEGKEIVLFGNYPPGNSDYSLFIGFTNDLVVDTYYGPPPKDEDKKGWR